MKHMKNFYETYTFFSIQIKYKYKILLFNN